MSGDEKRFTVTRGLRFGFDVCDGDEGDKTVLTLVNLSEAHAVAGELNRLAARSGSPEGWPEGAEPATLGAVLEAPDDWELRFGPNWIGAKHAVNTLKVFNKSFVLVARRKPKPVTRDVLAWDLEIGMTIASESDRPEVVARICRVETPDNRTVTVTATDGSHPYVDAPGLTVVTVLVEEPNE